MQRGDLEGCAFLSALVMAVASASDREAAGLFTTTIQTPAAVFGSAIAGVVANLAGPADASSPAEVAAVGKWLFGTLIVLPLAGSLIAWHALGLSKMRSDSGFRDLLLPFALAQTSQPPREGEWAYNGGGRARDALG
jgi:hypothetical protein